MIGFGFEDKITPKFLINIGALLDIPTASIITGAKGETIYNGGLGQITGIVGPGNNYKSTIEHYMMLTAAARTLEAVPTAMMTYDSEVNIQIPRLELLAKQVQGMPLNPVTEVKLSDGKTPLWYITDKATIAANKWAAKLGNYSEAKLKAKESKCEYQPFLDNDTGKPYVGTIPTFIEIDSFTEFEPESTIDMLDGDIDDSNTNTSELRKGLFKSKFMTTLPRITNQGNIFLFLLAHIGEKKDMATGPAKYSQPTRKSQYMKQGDTIKGVTEKFFFLTNNAWMLHSASALKNQGTKGPEYPAVNVQSENELNTVKVTQLRSKSGRSGYTLELVVSQTYGVLPTLTEFHHIKENNRFGITGTLTHYALDLLPEVSLGRTTVHDKINENALLRRAINITSELLQLQVFHPHLANEGLLITPKELYETIKQLGYDWNIILKTRGYWTINQYDHPVPYLSTVDLLKMCKGTYFPYFLNEDKTLNKKYQKLEE